MDDSLKSLAKKIPGGVCEVAFDEDFTLLYGNEGFYAMYGYTPAEMREELGNRLILAIHPEDVPHIRQEVAEAGEQNRGFEFEKRIYRNGRDDGVHAHPRHHLQAAERACARLPHPGYYRPEKHGTGAAPERGAFPHCPGADNRHCLRL